MTASTVLLVGLGQIGMGYDLNTNPETCVMTHARALSQHAAFELIAAVDPHREGCDTFERIYHRPSYPDVASALAIHQPDVVVVATPTTEHLATVQSVLQGATPRSILCEKPLALDLDEARAIVALCADRRVSLYVNYMRISDAAVVEVARRLASGEMRGPIKGVVWYSKGFLHNGSHFFNLMEYWLGAYTGGTIVGPGREWSGHDPEPDVRAHFENGTVMFLAAREEEYSHYTVELVASNGRLRYEEGGELVEWQQAVPDRVVPNAMILSPVREVIASGMRRSQWHVADQLARALNGGKASLCQGSSALATLEAMHRLLEMR